MDDWTDLALLVQEDCQFGLSEPATFTPDGGVPVAIRVIFNEAAEQVTLEDGIPTSTQRPIASVHLADLAAPPAQGDGLVVRGVAYKVVDIPPDGEGDVDLVLHRV